MKKIITVIIIALFGLSLTACNNSEKPQGPVDFSGLQHFAEQAATKATEDFIPAYYTAPCNIELTKISGNSFRCEGVVIKHDAPDFSNSQVQYEFYCNIKYIGPDDWQNVPFGKLTDDLSLWDVTYLKLGRNGRVVQGKLTHEDSNDLKIAIILNH